MKKNNTIKIELTVKNARGNPNLKAVGEKISLNEEQVAEYMRCSQDLEYFICNYVNIISLDEGLIKFQPWEYQKRIARTVNDNRFVIVKLPRQAGKTTIIAATLLWYVLFNEQWVIGILANKAAQSREILSRLKLAYEHLPKWIQQGVKTWNMSSIELENGSKIIASATSSSAVRGSSYNIVYLDEFAHVPPTMQEQFFTSVYPVITAGKTTKVLITSTPHGLDLFYKVWHDSEEGRNAYKRVEINWWDTPGRDEAWKQETINNTSEEQFRQEFGCEFLGSNDTLLSGTCLSRLVYNTPIEGADRGNGIRIYKKPEPGHNYCIVADTSRGIGIDYSAFTVIDTTVLPYEVVAVFRDNRVPTVIYPNYIHSASKTYNNAAILVETNDIGGQIADILNGELENEMVLPVGNGGRNGQVLGYSVGSRLGVRTSPAVKRIGCNAIKDLMENNKVIVNDFNIINEFSTFVAKGSTYQAEEGKHDDLVMTLVLFGWMTTQEYFKEMSTAGFRNTLLTERAEKIEEETLGFLRYSPADDAVEGEVKTLSSDTFERWLRSDPEMDSPLDSDSHFIG